VYFIRVLLNYIGGAIPTNDLELFEELLAKNDIEFRMHDYAGEYRASIDDLTGVISIILEATLITSFAHSIGSNAAWDAIKLMTVKVWGRTVNKKYSKVTASGIEEKNVTFSLRANLKTDNYSFKIDGIQSQEELSVAMDKVLTYLDQQKSKVDQHKIYTAIYDNKNKEWIVKDFLQEMAMKQRSENTEHEEK